MSNAENGFYDRVGTQAGRNLGTVAPQVSFDSPASTPMPEVAAMQGAKRWAANQDTFWGATQTYDALPAGIYRTGISQHIGPILLKQTVETDHLLALPDDATASILSEFDQFWRIEDAFASRGFLHKRGFLLWGPPGSGKTSTVQQMMQRLVNERSGIVLYLDSPEVAAQCLRLVRMIETRRPVVCIMEDLDALIQRYSENEYLALLDGEAQVANVVFVATTNYPERLDRRFVDRPSRFDTIRYVGMPTAEARRVYLQAKEPSLVGDELDGWVSRSDGYSIAHLKEMIIAIRCFGQTIDQACERLDAMRTERIASDRSPEHESMGFVHKAQKIASLRGR